MAIPSGAKHGKAISSFTIPSLPLLLLAVFALSIIKRNEDAVFFYSFTIHLSIRLHISSTSILEIPSGALKATTRDDNREAPATVAVTRLKFVVRFILSLNQSGDDEERTRGGYNGFDYLGDNANGRHGGHILLYSRDRRYQ